MKVNGPFQATEKESQEFAEDWHDQVSKMNVPNETLEQYVETFLDRYREVMSQFFPKLAVLIPFYTQYPFLVSIVRLGPNGVIIGYQPDDDITIRMLDIKDLDLPPGPVNFFEIERKLSASHTSFDFRIRAYSLAEAQSEATSTALSHALAAFWSTLDEHRFSDLCSDLLEREGLNLVTETGGTRSLDALAEITFVEPGGFRRRERWAFEYKIGRRDRVSVDVLTQVQHILDAYEDEVDIVCLMTSGDMTSIGINMAVGNPRIRIWDLPVLNHVAHDHLDSFGEYFPEYLLAVQQLATQSESDELPASVETVSRVEEFREMLKVCPPGKQHFSDYEHIGIQIWQHVFQDVLGEPRDQTTTADGKQRRDVLFPNLRATRFFARIADRFHADFVIVDFKNYADPVESSVVEEVAKYANKAVGRFVVIVSRKGAKSSSTEGVQHRIFRDDDKIVIVLSDEQMLEMIKRKEGSEQPEDILEDLLDSLLARY